MDLFDNLEEPCVITQLSPSEVEIQFLQLIQKVQATSLQSQTSIALAIGITPRHYQRVLKGQHKLTITLTDAIFNALGIDKTRALVAIEKFNDYSRYFDTTLAIAVDLIRPVVEAVNEAGFTAIEQLHPKAQEQLAKWIAKTVVENNLQICARREEIELMRTG